MVWLGDLGMAAKVRPALVMSVPAADTDRALAGLVPHTTSPRETAFEASVAVTFLRAGVFDAQNLVTVPHAKRLRSVGRLSALQLATSSERFARGLVFHNRAQASNKRYATSGALALGGENR